MGGSDASVLLPAKVNHRACEESGALGRQGTTCSLADIADVIGLLAGAVKLRSPGSL